MDSDAGADRVSRTAQSSSGSRDSTSNYHPQFVSVLPEPSFDPPVQIWFGNLKTGVKPHLLTAISSKVKILGVISRKEALCVNVESTEIAGKLLDYYYEMMEGGPKAIMPWWKGVVVEIGDGSGTEPMFEAIPSIVNQDRGDGRGEDSVEEDFTPERSNFNANDESIDGYALSGINRVHDGSTMQGQQSEGLQLKVVSMDVSSASAPERTLLDQTFVPLSPSTAFHSPSLSSSTTLIDSKHDAQFHLNPEDRLDLQPPVSSSSKNLPSNSSSTLHPLSTSDLSTIPILIRNMPPIREDQLRSALEDLILDAYHQIISHTPIRFRTSVRSRNFVACTEIQTSENEVTLLMRLDGRVIDGYRLSVQRANEDPQFSQFRKVRSSQAKNGKSSTFVSSIKLNPVARDVGSTTPNLSRLFLNLNSRCRPGQRRDSYYQDKLQKLFQPYTNDVLSFEMKFSAEGSNIAFVDVNQKDVSTILHFLDNSFLDGNRIHIEVAQLPKASGSDIIVQSSVTTSIPTQNPASDEYRKSTNFLPLLQESSFKPFDPSPIRKDRMKSPSRGFNQVFEAPRNIKPDVATATDSLLSTALTTTHVATYPDGSSTQYCNPTSGNRLSRSNLESHFNNQKIEKSARTNHSVPPPRHFGKLDTSDPCYDSINPYRDPKGVRTSSRSLSEPQMHAFYKEFMNAQMEKSREMFFELMERIPDL